MFAEEGLYLPTKEVSHAFYAFIWYRRASSGLILTFGWGVAVINGFQWGVAQGGLNINVEALGGCGGLPQKINILLLQGLKLASTVISFSIFCLDYL